MKWLNIEVGPNYDLGKRWEGTKLLGFDRDTEVLVELDLLAWMYLKTADSSVDQVRRCSVMVLPHGRERLNRVELWLASTRFTYLPHNAVKDERMDCIGFRRDRIVLRDKGCWRIIVEVDVDADTIVKLSSPLSLWLKLMPIRGDKNTYTAVVHVIGDARY